jgi:hypothetical protein
MGPSVLLHSIVPASSLHHAPLFQPPQLGPDLKGSEGKQAQWGTLFGRDYSSLTPIGILEKNVQNNCFCEWLIRVDIHANALKVEVAQAGELGVFCT